MLGFKSAIRIDPEKAWSALLKLRSCMDGLERYGLEHLTEERIILSRIVTRIFSDTILVFTLGDEADDLTGIVLLTAQLFAGALASCIPLRGGIAHGDFFVEDGLQLYCGAPFVKAYELGEQSQWSGIILDEVVADRFSNQLGAPFTTHGNIPTIVRWNVPLKSKQKIASWVVNWPLIYREGFKKRSPLSVQEYYEAFKPLLGPYEGLKPDDKAKHKNTVDFINAQLDAFPDAKVVVH